MKKLKKILEKKYQNSEELFDLLVNYNLDTIIKNAIENIDNKLKNGEIQNLPKLSGIILNDINLAISKIKNKTHKRKIEYLLSDIFQEYVALILKEKESSKVINDIIENLRIACEYRGYNYPELNIFLGLEKEILLKTKKVHKNIYYQWLRKDFELDEISKDLYDKKIIFSVKEFKKLFKPVSESFYVRFNIEYKDEIIVLFSIFKELNLIKPVGISGYFSPFVQCAVDNENNFLIKKAINKEHEKIKRNKVRYNKIKGKMMKIVNSNISEKL